jgi:hypothetical protein
LGQKLCGRWEPQLPQDLLLPLAQARRLDHPAQPGPPVDQPVGPELPQQRLAGPPLRRAEAGLRSAAEALGGGAVVRLGGAGPPAGARLRALQVCQGFNPAPARPAAPGLSVPNAGAGQAYVAGRDVASGPAWTAGPPLQSFLGRPASPATGPAPSVDLVPDAAAGALPEAPVSVDDVDVVGRRGADLREAPVPDVVHAVVAVQVDGEAPADGAVRRENGPAWTRTGPRAARESPGGFILPWRAGRAFSRPGGHP